MHAETQADFSDLPSIDDTIAAMLVLGRILDKLRSKLAVTEQAVARLAMEKSLIQKELRTIVEFASNRRVPTRTSAACPPATLNEFSALIKSIDASFGTCKRSPAH